MTMEDEPRIITVGKSHPPTDVAKWLRQQPHDRRIILSCVDAPSVRGEYPTHPSPDPCVDVIVNSLVAGQRAGVLVRVMDHQASDPARLFQIVIEEAEAAFADLVKGAEGQISEK
jgi:hypothetical protein